MCEFGSRPRWLGRSTPTHRPPPTYCRIPRPHRPNSSLAMTDMEVHEHACSARRFSAPLACIRWCAVAHDEWTALRVANVVQTVTSTYPGVIEASPFLVAAAEDAPSTQVLLARPARYEGADCSEPTRYPLSTAPPPAYDPRPAKASAEDHDESKIATTLQLKHSAFEMARRAMMANNRRYTAKLHGEECSMYESRA